MNSATYTFNPATGNVVTITFTSTSQRYVRLSITANSGAPGGQVAEFEIYGIAPPVPTPTPTLTPTATQTPTPTTTITPTPGQSPSPGKYGATLPYTEVQAEDAATNGTIISALQNRTYPSLANEAIGRKAVTLSGQGKYVEFTVPQNANSIVLRYSIPDGNGGAGIDATLALYINGVKQTDLAVTSRYGWIYGGYPFNNNPTDLRPHHFYDEVSRLVSQMTVGTKVKVQ